MHVTEDAQFVHVIFVGTAQDTAMTPDDFFDRLDEIESYRSGRLHHALSGLRTLLVALPRLSRRS